MTQYKDLNQRLDTIKPEEKLKATHSNTCIKCSSLIEKSSTDTKSFICCRTFPPKASLFLLVSVHLDGKLKEYFILFYFFVWELELTAEHSREVIKYSIRLWKTDKKKYRLSPALLFTQELWVPELHTIILYFVLKGSGRKTSLLMHLLWRYFF